MAATLRSVPALPTTTEFYDLITNKNQTVPDTIQGLQTTANTKCTE